MAKNVLQTIMPAQLKAVACSDAATPLWMGLSNYLVVGDRGMRKAVCSPGQDGAEGPYVWRYKFPHKRHPFKQNIWDIENGQQPLVLCIAFVE